MPLIERGKSSRLGKRDVEFCFTYVDLKPSR